MAAERTHASAVGKRWIIQGYDGEKPLERLVLPFRSWSEPRVIRLLQHLVSRHLSFSDVVDGARAPQDQLYNPVLKEGRSAGVRPTLTVGLGLRYVAALYQANEQDQ